MAYELIEKQTIFEGRKVKLEVQHLFDSVHNRRIAREVVAHPGAVVILPILDPQKLRIVLIKNRRIAVNQTLIELPAGTLEKNEIPMNCAGRELLEETGFLAGKLKPLGNFYTSPGILSEKMYAFAAYDLQEKKPSLEEGEEIELLTATLDESIAMIQRGEIADGKTIATLLMYDRFHRNPK